MKTDTCCSQHGDWCESGYAERPRFYPRQLITPDDLTLGIEYLLKLQRRHNRLMHGWGVVCGAQVAPIIPANSTGEARPWKVVVKPGYILDPLGREILIDTEVCFDLRHRCITGVTGEVCGEKVDPWCSDVYVRPEDDRPLYVAVQYKQVQSRPVRVQPVGCGCDDSACEFSRWRDAFEICTLDECPDEQRHDHTPGETPEDRDTRHPIPDCPECPAEAWVVLAEVKINREGVIEYIDNCSCRRLVRSFAHEWWHCDRLEVDPLDQTLTQGATNQAIEIRGRELVKEMRIVLPRGVTESADRQISTNNAGVTTLRLTVNVADDAEPGAHPLLIIHPDGSMRRGKLTIETAGGAARPTGGGGTKGSLRRPRREP